MSPGGVWDSADFSRDSMNFIGVLAIIAGLGFAVSAIQFVRIGVSSLIAQRKLPDWCRSNGTPSLFARWI